MNVPVQPVPPAMSALDPMNSLGLVVAGGLLAVGIGLGGWVTRKVTNMVDGAFGLEDPGMEVHLAPGSIKAAMAAATEAAMEAATAPEPKKPNKKHQAAAKADEE